jgi:hypothetical protein
MSAKIPASIAVPKRRSFSSKVYTGKGIHTANRFKETAHDRLEGEKSVPLQNRRQKAQCF